MESKTYFDSQGHQFVLANNLTGHVTFGLVGSEMILNKNHVKDLLPDLIYFAEHGVFPDEEPTAEYNPLEAFVDFCKNLKNMYFTKHDSKPTLIIMHKEEILSRLIAFKDEISSLIWATTVFQQGIEPMISASAVLIQALINGFEQDEISNNKHGDYERIIGKYVKLYG